MESQQRSFEQQQANLEHTQKKLEQVGQNIAGVQAKAQDSCNSPNPSPSPSSGVGCDHCDRNGIYEDADYHGKTDNVLKSKRPRDGQAALANSLANPNPSSNFRIGISQGEFVVLSRTQEADPSIGRPAKYHGHVRPWNQLDSWMKKVLVDAEMVKTKKSGNVADILKDNCP